LKNINLEYDLCHLLERKLVINFSKMKSDSLKKYLFIYFK